MSQRALAQQDAAGAQDILLADARLSPLPCGALWWASTGVLVVSDLHLEKGSSFAARGQLLPPYDTRVTLEKVARLVEALNPRMVISLGDSFHDGRASQRMSADDAARLKGLTDLVDWVWIAGNHDPAPPEQFGGRRVAELQMDGLVFRHEAEAAGSDFEISGHYHPVARVVGKGAMVRSRCFVTDGRRLIMPAYGALTGGLNVLDPAIQALFPEGCEAAVLGPDRVYRAPMHRLAPDARPSAPRLPSDGQ